jgi:hypothetical protein
MVFAWMVTFENEFPLEGAGEPKELATVRLIPAFTLVNVFPRMERLAMVSLRTVPDPA